MENIIITIACIALILMSSVSFASSSINSIDKLTSSWKQTEKISSDMRTTVITSVSSQVYDSGSRIEVVIRNDGSYSLSQFNKWDVILKYQNGNVAWIPYTTATPGWTVSGIYLNGSPEIYEPNIFNPLETMKLNIKLSTALSSNTTNLATIATFNGKNTEITVIR
jgi:hypothetical protein